MPSVPQSESKCLGWEAGETWQGRYFLKVLPGHPNMYPEPWYGPKEQAKWTRNLSKSVFGMQCSGVQILRKSIWHAVYRTQVQMQGGRYFPWTQELPAFQTQFTHKVCAGNGMPENRVAPHEKEQLNVFLTNWKVGMELEVDKQSND